jgi:transmembrane sensor
MNESDERFVYLFSSYFKKTATEKEINELFQLITQSVNNDRLTLLMKQAWGDMQTAEPLFQPDKSDEIFNRILLAGKKQADNNIIESRFGWKKYVAAAAMLLISASLYFGLKQKDPAYHYLAQKPVKVIHDALPGSNKAILTLADGSQVPLDNKHLGTLSKQGQTTVSNTSNGKLIYTSADGANESAVPQINTLTTPRGGQYQIILPDGSKVCLNATSSIKYPTFFSGKNRRVEITGEVYFEVAKNPVMPFIVKTSHTEIEVFGTHFDVMAYDDEEATKTTLQEGSVKIKGDKWSGVLKPGQQAVQNNHDGSSIIKEVDVDQELAWKNGLFQFTDDDIQSIMRKACRWYDLNVVYEGKIPVKQYSGRISRNVKASELLNMLKYTGVNADIKEKTIYIRN